LIITRDKEFLLSINLRKNGQLSYQKKTFYITFISMERRACARLPRAKRRQGSQKI